MKLLIYSHDFAPGIGGVETSVALLARGLHALVGENGEKAFDVTLVTEKPSQGLDDRAFPFPVIRRPSALLLWRLIRHHDVVHIAGPALLPMLLASISFKPFVLEHHGYQAICLNGLLLHQPDATVCPGHFQARNYSECWRCHRAQFSQRTTLLDMLKLFARSWLARRAVTNIGITNHVVSRHQLPRSRRIYYGIQPPATAAPGTIVHTDPPREPQARVLRFAFVGRFVPEKGLLVLLKAAKILAKRVPAFELFLIGDGPERAAIENTIQRECLEEFVRLPGFLEGPELARLLSGTDAVIMPSIWEETAGLSAIEQMMRGRMVIAADIGGLAEVVGDTALKFPPGEAEGLAERMERVLREPAVTKRYGDLARNRAHELFAVERMIAEHAQVYRDSLSRRG